MKKGLPKLGTIYKLFKDGSIEEEYHPSQE